MNNWDVFLTPYKQAVEELKVKLKGIREQYQKSSKHTPIEFVTGRVKPISSILDKAIRKNIPLDQLEEKMQDLAGLRIVTQFVEDIETVVQLIRSRSDFEIVEERDYVEQKKDSGYRSYHLVLRYPVQTIEGEKRILVELQIRTLAMNFWATIEHSLNYKYSGEIPLNIKTRLQRAAEAAFRLDEEMSQIRDEVREAQQIITRKQEQGRTLT
ncbi:GTP pyrophosphokinase family protein [Halalkalibacterium halodurans]|uniref:GTP diphosphokinase n=2 Tax=Halalkalibacterium halodurans TaxID=86665 RepID=Q9K903_HALH5|nr:GTP pyrophosphokinase family protein [Halalkalibacterium halodurans]MDY7223400.1 GTP pyrophosphokinase family protein [Halalkalibacterium halodurans]MDY7242621.1 GTP pyrophosphokinase family protein [Halalkalibacterium halodurans]MED4081672.1 GTP pyrophosphokinase family protein [Halalkalibacterium halodurans]MED4085225.1 GTP pyrophosphokinase family protein [Halalkalibacterium halodurans]MED4104197.1 GTP pyrophosphokinase family protein [Halalkalibacterium halodurans]